MHLLMISDKDSAELRAAVTEVVYRLMDKHHPGWREKHKEFETFQAYSAWVTACLDSIIILPDNPRNDH